MIDGVLEQVEYDDDDLCCLTSYGKGLAGSHEKLLNVLERIKDLEWQVWGC